MIRSGGRTAGVVAVARSRVLDDGELRPGVASAGELQDDQHHDAEKRKNGQHREQLATAGGGDPAFGTDAAVVGARDGGVAADDRDPAG